MTGTAAVVLALGSIWRLVIQPMAELIVLQKQALPILRDLVKTLGDVPTPFNVLEEIIAEFRTDSGSSLRDVVNRLESTANVSRLAVEGLQVAAEAGRLLSVQDRQEFLRMMVGLDRLAIRVDAEAGKTVAEAARVRANLIVTQDAVDHVAADLSNSHERADATHGAPGEAGDAASRSPA